jgi:hypothetical protein
MCQQVLQGHRSFETPRQLVELFGTADVLEWKHHQDHMDWCLCAIDLPRTFGRVGLRWKHGTEPTIFLVDE